MTEQLLAPEESVPVGAVTGGDGADEGFRAGEGLVLSVFSAARCKGRFATGM